MKDERKKVWIDIFQTGLVIRVSLYWLLPWSRSWTCCSCGVCSTKGRATRP